jgi:hypothetical protein
MYSSLAYSVHVPGNTKERDRARERERCREDERDGEFKREP